MADEPRRSGRSTKGQHKNLDLVNETPAKKSKKVQAKDKAAKPSAEPTPAPSEEEEEIIRCICGEYEEEEDIERDMICCDSCSAWQHNDCMGLTFAKGEVPDEYYCEQCKPEHHKVLLEKMARGEKPWEEVAERRRKEAEELKQSKRKKGKKGGRRGRPSEAKPEASTPARTTAPRQSATPSETPAAATTTPAVDKTSQAPEERAPSSQKRKFSEQPDVSTPESGPKSKQQKVSPPAAASTAQAKPAPVKDEPATQPSLANATTAQPPKSFKDISIPARRNAANALAKVFVDQLADALARGSFKLPQDKSGEDVGQQLGLSVEDALYQNLCGGSGEPTEAYKLQLRTILFNVKKNPSLRDRLLVGSLSPEALSRMSSQDMASEELQQKDAEIKAEAERQHIIIQEQGPRIRRTHKGEEIVEDDQVNISSEPVFSAAPRRSLAETDGSPAVQSPTSPTAKQPETDGEKTAGAQEATPVERKGHDEHFPPRSHSPGAGQEQVFPEVATHIREPIPTGKVQADAEIDQLLKDDDEPDSPPYSPKDNHEEGSIWHGKVTMKPISAEFSSFARHVGGADLSARIPWSQLVPSTLNIDGRIDIKLASDYLCGLRYSTSTDVTVVSISSPISPKEKTGFDTLFDYFQDRKRYGVVGKHPLPAVKDTYLIPIEAGSTKKPEFIELLENNSLEDTTTERVLLVVFAIKTGESNTPSVQPPSQHSSMEPAASASPLTVAGTPQQAHFATPGPRPGPTAHAQYPPTPSPAFSAGAPQAPAPAPYHQQPQPQPQGQQQPPQIPSHNSFQPPQPPLAQSSATGLAAAIQVLGGQANSPAIQQLLQQAPNVTTVQLNIVRDILVRQPQAASDYQLLMNELYHATTTNGNGNGHAPQQPPPAQ
ncbi:putative PHD finger domain protein [Aspergillus undulatus]|uniref:putative PHD finger domain protein n=1 Tax=Aspergillus undulatus TaxID=1810928 RepID=UPI003CCD983E